VFREKDGLEVDDVRSFTAKQSKMKQFHEVSSADMIEDIGICNRKDATIRSFF
jgi:hypothetical protein